MIWQRERASQARRTQHFIGPATGGHDGRRRFFALRKEEISWLLRLPVVCYGEELHLACHPLYGPVEIILGDHIIRRHEEHLPDALVGAPGTWLEMHARYAADLEMAQIRIDRVLQRFEIDSVDCLPSRVTP